jgi:hypothetical protein
LLEVLANQRATSLLKRAGVKSLEHVADGDVPTLEEEGIDLVPEG